VKLLELHIGGFGRLTDRTVSFDPRFNVIYGPNEAGKSTLTGAILASLYGCARGERDSWRPWSGARYGATLKYVLSDGREFEVQRDFERDGKGVHVYDASGNDVSGECSVGRNVVPGLVHLGVPLEVFLNASYVAQGEVEIDGSRAERISHALAQALDGGPREDAALGAIKRLDDALATHVGSRRATVHAPLRRLAEEMLELEERSEEVRQRLRELDELRGRLAAETARTAELEEALREHERRTRAVRAFAVRSRLEALREIRDELAELQAKRAEYNDVEAFSSVRVPELESLYREWHTLEALAVDRAGEAAKARVTPALLAELDERLSQGGALDEEAFGELEEAAKTATEARDKATFAANEVQAAHRSIDGGSELFGAAFASGIFVAAGAALLAFFADWMLAAPTAALALFLFIFAWTRWSKRRAALRRIAEMQASADRAVLAEREAAEKVAHVLEPLGVTSLEELTKRRHRAQELTARREAGQHSAERAAVARAQAERAAGAFDELARSMIPVTGSREADLAAAKWRESRRSARDGIDVRLSMLDVRRNDVLRNEDEFALAGELSELIASGTNPAPLESGVSGRAFESERADLERRASESRSAAAAGAAELRTAEGQIGDLAALDEQVQRRREECARLERFEAALALARDKIDERTREAHQKFARRLGDYASRTLSEVTGGRYGDVRIDPTTLAVRVRAPETGAIVDVSELSAGTREQAYLVVRLAMLRMFGEGIETAPLLLDDPFSYWDESRIERGFPVLEAAANEAQVILFTASRDLCDTAAQRGARVIELSDGAPGTKPRLRSVANLPMVQAAAEL
jgi:DNA repair exonuclease SbcCD ATPase subunit